MAAELAGPQIVSSSSATRRLSFFIPRTSGSGNHRVGHFGSAQSTSSGTTVATFLECPRGSEVAVGDDHRWSPRTDSARALISACGSDYNSHGYRVTFVGSGFPLGRTPVPKPENLGEAVQRYGYAKKRKIKLYGKELEIVSDPVNTEGEDVFVNARDKGTEDVKRVQVSRNVVEMAKRNEGNKKK